MAGSRQVRERGARERARAARSAILAEQRERERRVEDAVVDYFTAEEARAVAAAAVSAAETRMGLAVTALLEEGESADVVARMCEISEADVRRLRRAGATTPDANPTLSSNGTEGSELAAPLDEAATQSGEDSAPSPVAGVGGAEDSQSGVTPAE